MKLMNTHAALMNAVANRRRSWRQERMRAMLDLVGPPPRARIIDLGGTEEHWKLIDHDFHVTLVNLPDFNPRVPSDPGRYAVVEGDACDLRGAFADNSFDFVFSNSVIEHVGAEAKQEAFASEARRLAPSYWVQTPSRRSVVEPHTGIPLYWDLPSPVRERILSNWHKQFPGWVDMLRETRVLTRERMRELFPGSELFVERVYGLEKSYTCYRPYPKAS